MSEPKLISPLLDGFVMGEPMSDHHGVRCCPAIREHTEERYIVKIISIPASQKQLDALLLSRVYSDRTQAHAYFKDLADSTVNETKVLDRLSRSEGILPFSGVQIVEMDDGVGFDIYLLSPYRTTLDRHMCSQPLTHLAAVNLGLDMCAALHACRQAGYLYLDLKPSNIYLTQNHGYCIGDLGLLPMTSLKYASLPEKYRSSYTAPEIKDAMSELNDTMDIYALGLTLYQVFNNGQLPFEGPAPGIVLPPPMYADYEMAEIILKACAPDPKNRWQSPAQMGQELVNYMQRNNVNDVSVVPAPIELPEQEVDEEEEFLSEDENEAQLEALLAMLPEEEFPDDPPVECEDAPTTADSDTDLTFIGDENADETLPTQENAADLADSVVTEEVAEILAQADELIAHELPEPVVAPAPIDVPIPPPIVPEPEPEELVEDITEDNVPETPEIEDTPTDEPQPKSEAEPITATEDETTDAEPSEEDTDEDEADILPAISKKERHRKLLIGITITALVLACLVFGGWVFYKSYYLQTIDQLTLQSSAQQLTVLVSSSVDEELLSVTCTDTYGNTLHSSVTDGMAVFHSLNPNTQYKIQVSISGLHKLQGNTTTNYTTPAHTEILNFTAICGPEDGSAILNFSVNGPDSDEWLVEYGADGIAPMTREFTGHSVTITGLTVGAEYTFRLVPKDALHITGANELQYVAGNVIYAQNLTISSCGGGSLTAVWSAPDGAAGAEWVVRCYNDQDYDRTITTTELTAVFDELDHSTGYTVQVIATGMTQSTTASVTANPITVTEFSTDTSAANRLTVNWSFDGTAPSGWIVVYSVNGAASIQLECPQNTVTVPLFHGCNYGFTVRPADEVTYFSEDFTFEAPAAVPFTGYGVSAADMTFSMCLTPSKANWDRYDLKASDYTTTFISGQKASFLVKLTPKYGVSADQIVTTFVIRDENYRLISEDTTSATWEKMWYKKYCELDIPALPETAGTYVVDIYFNGMLAGSQSFTVTAPVNAALN